MSSDNEWEDDEQDEGEDFVLDECNEDEDDEYDEEEDEDSEDDIPTFLQGEMSIDSSVINTSNKNVKFVGSNFCLACQTPNFAFGTPGIGKYFFEGWINDPGIIMEFAVYFSKQPLSTVDPLEMKLLEAQEKELLTPGIEENKEISSAKKTGKNTIDGRWMNDKKSPAKKAPPVYSLIKTGDVKESTECGENNTKYFVEDVVFVVSGTQIGNNEKDNKKITFRGSYRCPLENFIERLHLICSIQANDGAASGTAMTSGAAASAGAVSVSKKRNRLDDDSIEDGDAHMYQELIDLHDDTRLSTEDLRKKYYGSEERMGKDTKKHASKGTYDTSSNKKDDNDNDDEDDAYGF